MILWQRKLYTHEDQFKQLAGCSNQLDTVGQILNMEISEQPCQGEKHFKIIKYPWCTPVTYFFATMSLSKHRKLWLKFRRSEKP